MAVGIDFLRAVCAEQNVSLLHQVDATYFLDDEQPFYRFVRNHYDNYHSLPDASIRLPCRNRGICPAIHRR